MDNQDHPLATSFARIFYSTTEKKNTSCGAGVALRGNLVLTCAHVVIDALKLQNKAEVPDQVVYLDFPLSECSQQFRAKVIFWDPKIENTNGEGYMGNDLAGLELVETLPAQVAQVSLKIIDDFWEHSASVFGFRAMSRIDDFGGWTRNTLLKPETHGWVQMESDSDKGEFIKVGFSGTPVWDENEKSCVGIIAAVDIGEKKRISYMIPAGKIKRLWNDVSVQRDEKKKKKVNALQECPLLLPYRVDCTDQIDDFYELCKKNKLESPLPMIAVVHGNHHHAHDMFLKRLEEEVVPNLFKIKPNSFTLNWSAHISNITDLGRKLTREIADHYLYRDASCEEVQSVIASYNCPVIIEMELLTGDWKTHKKGVINAILDFWNTWPPLAPRQQLFVFLCVTHKISDNWFIHRFRHHQILKEIEDCASHHYPRVHVHPFSQLRDIEEDEARNWARMAAQEFGVDVNLLLSQIGELFKDGKPRPLGLLAPKLKEILTSTSGD